MKTLNYLQMQETTGGRECGWALFALAVAGVGLALATAPIAASMAAVVTASQAANLGVGLIGGGLAGKDVLFNCF